MTQYNSLNVKLSNLQHDKLKSAIEGGTEVVLTLFRMGIFGAAHKWGGCPKKIPLPKICHRYPTIMKLGNAISYLKKIKKIYDHVTHTLSSADICIFSLEISKFCYIKKYRHRLHFDTEFLILLTFLESLINMVITLMIP